MTQKLKIACNPIHISKLIKILTKIQTQPVMKFFLDGLLTPKEIEELSLRLEIVTLLKKGWTQREVADKLKVSIATVTRGAKEVQKGRFEVV